jgi:hypothetical protein
MSDAPEVEVFIQPTKYWLAVPLGNNRYLAVWGPLLKYGIGIKPVRAAAKIIRGSHIKKIAEKKSKGYYTGGTVRLTELGPCVVTAISNVADTAGAIGLASSEILAAAFGKEWKSNGKTGENIPSLNFPESPVVIATLYPWSI